MDRTPQRDDPPPYEVAPLPKDEVDKIRQLEQELSDDTGEEVVLVAYRRKAGDRR